MSSEESRIEIARVVLGRMYRDQCVDNALRANVIDAERAAALKNCDSLEQLLEALGEDLHRYGLDNGLTATEFDILYGVIMFGPIDFE